MWVSDDTCVSVDTCGFELTLAELQDIRTVLDIVLTELFPSYLNCMIYIYFYLLTFFPSVVLFYYSKL